MLGLHVRKSLILEARLFLPISVIALLAILRPSRVCGRGFPAGWCHDTKRRAELRLSIDGVRKIQQPVPNPFLVPNCLRRDSEQSRGWISDFLGALRKSCCTCSSRPRT